MDRRRRAWRGARTVEPSGLSTGDSSARLASCSHPRDAERRSRIHGELRGFLGCFSAAQWSSRTLGVGLHRDRDLRVLRNSHVRPPCNSDLPG